MSEETELPGIPEIPKVEKKSDGETETIEEEAKEVEEEQLAKRQQHEPQVVDIAAQKFKEISAKIRETVDIETLKPYLQETIIAKLKEGDVILIGEKIGVFAEKIAEEGHNVIARDTSVTYVSPKTEVNNHTILEKVDIKPFVMHKFKEIQGFYRNIILFFALKRLSRKEIEELLTHCKKILSREGQIVIVDEFYPRNLLLWILTMLKIGFEVLREKITKQQAIKPCRKIEKIINKLELKFYDVKHEAAGRIRTYIVSKRWSALLNERLI